LFGNVVDNDEAQFLNVSVATVPNNQIQQYQGRDGVCKFVVCLWSAAIVTQPTVRASMAHTMLQSSTKPTLSSEISDKCVFNN
jgi:hypothetical protein